jgi:nucleoid-associated protein YejK
MTNDEKNVDLKFIVAHKLFKEHNSPSVDKRLATELVPNGEEANIFVKNFHKANTTKKGLQYGSFITDSKKYPVQEYISSYILAHTSDSFLGMSVNIANKFETVLKDDLRSTGGYLIVFAYDDKDKGEIVAIAVMSDKTDSGLDEKTLKFTKNVVLNLESMGLASTVMIDRWTNPNNDVNYLTFMSGLREVSEYYKNKFLGCSNVQKSTLATKTLMDAIEEYYKSKGYVEKDLQPIREKVVEYIDSHQDEAVLQEIENRLFPDIKEQDEFLSFIDERKIELSASFKPNRGTIKSWRCMVYESRGIKIDISRERVCDQTVEYYDKTLIIHDDDGTLGTEFSKFKMYEEEN